MLGGGEGEGSIGVGRVIDCSCFRQMDRLKARYWRADSEIGRKTCISFTYNIFSLNPSIQQFAFAF